MRSHFLLSFGAVATLLSCNPWTAAAQMGNDSVRVEVQVKSDQDRKEIPNSRVDTVTQNKTLMISVRGKVKEPETRTAKWKVYGRGVDDHALVLLESGDFAVDLKDNGIQKVTSKTVTVTYTPQYTMPGGKGGRPKKVDAKGSKYVGYTVEVKDGEKVVGELADPQNLKSELKTAAEPKAEPKK